MQLTLFSLRRSASTKLHLPDALLIGCLAKEALIIFLFGLAGYNFSDKPQKIEEYSADLVISDVREVARALGAGKPVHVVSTYLLCTYKEGLVL